MTFWQEILSDFETRLQEWGAGCGVEVDFPTLWKESRFAGVSLHLVTLSGSVDLLLYVKVRTTEPGFWGLNPNRLGMLRGGGRNWSVLLLLGSAQTGYLVPSAEVDRAIESGEWRLSSGAAPEFKVHERDVNKARYFRSFDDLTSRIGPNPING